MTVSLTALTLGCYPCDLLGSTGVQQEGKRYTNLAGRSPRSVLEFPQVMVFKPCVVSHEKLVLVTVPTDQITMRRMGCENAHASWLKHWSLKNRPSRSSFDLQKNEERTVRSGKILNVLPGWKTNQCGHSAFRPPYRCHESRLLPVSELGSSMQ